TTTYEQEPQRDGESKPAPRSTGNGGGAPPPPEGPARRNGILSRMLPCTAEPEDAYAICDADRHTQCPAPARRISRPGTVPRAGTNGQRHRDGPHGPDRPRIRARDAALRAGARRFVRRLPRGTRQLCERRQSPEGQGAPDDRDDQGAQRPVLPRPYPGLGGRIGARPRDLLHV